VLGGTKPCKRIAVNYLAVEDVGKRNWTACSITDWASSNTFVRKHSGGGSDSSFFTRIRPSA
jgi:hypothetical protein